MLFCCISMDYQFNRSIDMAIFTDSSPLAPSLNLSGTGRQDCRDLHAWGPGVRPVYIIHHVLHGKGFLETQKMCFSISAGESFLICPYETIYYYPDPADPWEYTWVEFDGRDAAVLLQESAMSPVSPVCSPLADAPLALLFDRLQHIDIYRKNHAEAIGLLYTLLGIYADGFPACAQPLPEETELLSTAIRLIRTNYHHSSFTAEQLCRMLGVSRSTLYRIFQKELSSAPSRFITDFRLRQARHLLSRGSAVKTTALSCGFSDPFYFSRLFHKEMGTSPSEYRRLHSKV